MRPSAVRLFLVACACAFTVDACNSILDNSSASLGADGGDAFPKSSADGDSTDATSSTDASNVDAAALVETGDANACSEEEKSCDGTCVAITDPSYGCGTTTCGACTLTHASAACAGSECTVSECDPGYANCDNVAENGCETDLSRAATCGSCNASCGVAAPDCAPVGASFECTTGCPAAAPTLCGNQCVDLSTSTDHCGDCNTACAAVPNATVQCASSACTFTCTAGTANCDAIASNGCESVLATDPKNCGACGKVCPGTACAKGVCDAAPPSDAGTSNDSGSASDASTGGSSDAAQD